MPRYGTAHVLEVYSPAYVFEGYNSPMFIVLPIPVVNIYMSSPRYALEPTAIL